MVSSTWWPASYQATISLKAATMSSIRFWVKNVLFFFLFWKISFFFSSNVSAHRLRTVTETVLDVDSPSPSSLNPPSILCKWVLNVSSAIRLTYSIPTSNPLQVSVVWMFLPPSVKSYSLLTLYPLLRSICWNIGRLSYSQVPNPILLLSDQVLRVGRLSPNKLHVRGRPRRPHMTGVQDNAVLSSQKILNARSSRSFLPASLFCRHKRFWPQDHRDIFVSRSNSVLQLPPPRLSPPSSPSIPKHCQEVDNHFDQILFNQCRFT